MNKKILVCGLGSMGERRIKILTGLYPECQIYGVDICEDRLAQVKKKYGIDGHADLKNAFNRFCPDIVFACTSPLEHTDLILFALEKKAHTFSEINLNVHGYDQISDTAHKKKRLAFLSSTFLYHSDINWIICRAQNEKPLSYRYHIGQYLPDWHPWESYSQFFVAHPKTNACREIMAIDLPWLIQAFGDIIRFKGIKTKHSDLDVDYPDTFHLIFVHERGHTGTISVDCVSQNGGRFFEMYSDKINVEWQGKPGSLSQYHAQQSKMLPVPDTEKKHDLHVDLHEDAYVNEVREFFFLIDAPECKPKYGYEQDKQVIRLIDRIEEECELF